MDSLVLASSDLGPKLVGEARAGAERAIELAEGNAHVRRGHDALDELFEVGAEGRGLVAQGEAGEHVGGDVEGGSLPERVSVGAAVFSGLCGGALPDAADRVGRLAHREDAHRGAQDVARPPVIVAVFEHDAALEDPSHRGLRVAAAEAEGRAAGDHDRFIGLLADEEDHREDEARAEDPAVTLEALVEEAARVAEEVIELGEAVAPRYVAERRTRGSGRER